MHLHQARRPGVLLLGVAGLLPLALLLPDRAVADPPPSEPNVVQEQGGDRLAALIEEWTDEFFPGNPERYEEHLTDPLYRHLEQGRTVFLQNCSGCHGQAADGAGEAAPMLVPKPRNFRHGLAADSPPVFKFRSTQSGMPPLVTDLERTIRNGLPGSAMPAHRLMSPEDLRAVADYILWVAQTSEFRMSALAAYEDEEPDLDDAEELQDFHDEIVAEEAARIRERYSRPALVIPGPEPPFDEASIARGREIYTEQGCIECHGPNGRGDGSSSPFLVDDWGYPIDPRDFTTGRFRAGNDGHSVYMRIAGGVTGTPMPSFAHLDNESLWHLVHYVLSLGQGGEQ